MAYGSGSWRIRTADPLLVRQMLWTSWAKLPFVKAWDCKGSYYFLISKLFISFFSKGLVISLEARPHQLICGIDYLLLPTSGRHHISLNYATFVCIPRTLAPEQGLEPRTPWLTVMCSNRLSYSGICKEPLSFDCGAKVDIIFYSANFFAKILQKKYHFSAKSQIFY